MKPAPPFDPAEVGSADEQITLIERSFYLLTPMFGGGVEVNGPEKPHDPVTPIRVATIRGQLRFWWRACNPGGAADVTTLRQQEAAVWGSTSSPSSVTIICTQQPLKHIQVDVYKFNKEKFRWDISDGQREIAYGAFPLKPGEKDPRPGTLSEFKDPVFKLTLCCDKKDSEGIREALIAWSLFGGLGGRTRRGFGAFELTHHEPEDPLTTLSPEAFLLRLRGRHVIPGVPSLVDAKLEIQEQSYSRPIDAWKVALGALQGFRQGPGIGRNPRGENSRSPAGRSRWPEPDQIRRLLGKHATKHKPEHRVKKFPRAAFGLPIIFHFSTSGDHDATLNLKGYKRLASPLILRPIRRGDRYAALALVLSTSELPDQLELQPTPPQGSAKTPAPFTVTGRLTPSEARDIGPLRTCGGSTSPLDAFLVHFSKA